MIVCRGPFSQNLRLIPPSILSAAPMQKKVCFFVCLKSIFCVCIMSRSYHNKAEFILLRLRRSGINIVKKATTKTRERSL